MIDCIDNKLDKHQYINIQSAVKRILGGDTVENQKEVSQNLETNIDST